MARWTASAKWGAAPALDGQCATLLGLALSEVLGRTLWRLPAEQVVELPLRLPSTRRERGNVASDATDWVAFRALRGLKN